MKATIPQRPFPEFDLIRNRLTAVSLVATSWRTFLTELKSIQFNSVSWIGARVLSKTANLLRSKAEFPFWHWKCCWIHTVSLVILHVHKGTHHKKMALSRCLNWKHAQSPTTTSKPPHLALSACKKNVLKLSQPEPSCDSTLIDYSLTLWFALCIKKKKSQFLES